MVGLEIPVLIHHRLRWHEACVLRPLPYLSTTADVDSHSDQYTHDTRRRHCQALDLVLACATGRNQLKWQARGWRLCSLSHTAQFQPGCCVPKVLP